MKVCGLIILCLYATRLHALSIDLPPEPTVNAGTDKIVNTAVLQDATVSNATLLLWTQQSGPLGGLLVFGSPLTEDTTIQATAEGLYVARLTGSAGVANAFDEITFIWDVTSPVITQPPNIIVEAADGNGAVAAFELPVVSDLHLATVSANPPSGSQFPLGVTTVTVTATDAAGNISTAAFTVTVQDTTPPQLSSDVVAEATSPDGAVVSFVAAVDNTDPAPTITASPPSGSVFPLGTNTVNVTAVDASGNIKTGFFLVTVRDTTPPQLIAPANVQVATQGPGGAVVAYLDAVAQDFVSAVTLSYSTASGSTFPVGRTTVLVTATDAAGNSAFATFLVEVVDPDAPAISSPLTLTPNPALVSQTVIFSASFSSPSLNWQWDFGDGITSSQQNSVSHAFAAAGVYYVTLTVTDSALRTTLQSMPLTVIIPPVGGGGTPEPPRLPLSAIKLRGKAVASKPGRDQFSLKVALPDLPRDFNPSGATLRVAIGGAIAGFNLDGRGRSKTATGSASLKVSLTKVATLQIKATGAFLSQWLDEGFDLQAASGIGSALFIIDIDLNGVLFSDDSPTTTKIRNLKSGQFGSL